MTDHDELLMRYATQVTHLENAITAHTQRVTNYRHDRELLTSWQEVLDASQRLMGALMEVMEVLVGE